MTTSREWNLTRRPHGVPVDDDFALVDVELHAPGDGEIVVRDSFLSVDPYMRGRMNDAKSYVPPFQLGQPMDGEAVGVVEQVTDGAVDSNGSAIAVGEPVIHPLGWRTVSLLHGKHARDHTHTLAPTPTHLRRPPTARRPTHPVTLPTPRPPPDLPQRPCPAVGHRPPRGPRDPRSWPRGCPLRVRGRRSGVRSLVAREV